MSEAARRQTALITGASSGFGVEFAKLFARDGYDLVLVARSLAKMEVLAERLRARYSISATVLPADLSDPDSPRAIWDALEREGIGVDVLVNNAGFATHGRFAEIAYEPEREEMQVNIVSLTLLTKLFLPPMLARGQGGILNVASTAAFLSGPLMSVYYASKAYVLSFTTALAEEVRGSGVTVTCLCPGASRTGFADRAEVHNTRLFRAGAMDARTVALAGYRGFRQKKTVVIPGLQNALVVQATRFAPRRLAARMVMAAQE
ncbi:MAG: SDR family NAD(P)-dependent oxidoreductase [Chloroflexia bacterium]